MQRDLDDLSDLQEQAARIQARIRAQVDYLREQETPWSVIGECLNITKQGAAQRYGQKPEPKPDRDQLTLPSV